MLSNDNIPEFHADGLFMRMDITNNCNLKCKTCYFSLKGFKAKGRFMTPEEFEVICKKMSGHVRRLGFSCAFEPLIHPRFMEFLPHLKFLGSNVMSHINTNAICLDKNIAEAMVEHQLKSISVSLDGATDEVNAKIRVNHAFKHILKQIGVLNSIKLKLKSEYPVVSINFTLLKENLHELPDIVSLAYNIGVPSINVIHVMPIEGCGMSEQSCLLFPEETAKMYREARERAEKSNITLHLPPYQPKPFSELNGICKDLWDGFYIYPDGASYPCTYLTHFEPAGNIMANSIEEILNSSSLCSLKQKHIESDHPKECLDCLCNVQTVNIKKDRNFIMRFSR